MWGNSSLPSPSQKPACGQTPGAVFNVSSLGAVSRVILHLSAFPLFRVLPTRCCPPPPPLTGGAGGARSPRLQQQLGFRPCPHDNHFSTETSSKRRSPGSHCPGPAGGPSASRLGSPGAAQAILPAPAPTGWPPASLATPAAPPRVSSRSALLAPSVPLSPRALVSLTSSSVYTHLQGSLQQADSLVY